MKEWDGKERPTCIGGNIDVPRGTWPLEIEAVPRGTAAYDLNGIAQRQTDQSELRAVDRSPGSSAPSLAGEETPAIRVQE